MPPCKSLSAALYLLCLTLPLAAEPPNGGRLKRNNDDRRQTDPSRDVREKMTIPDAIGGKTYDDWKKDLDHLDPSVRDNAVVAILGFGEKATEAVPKLIAVLKKEVDAGVRAKILLALRILPLKGADRKNTIQAVGHVVGNDSQAAIRYEAVQTLTRLITDEPSVQAAQAIIGDVVRCVSVTSSWQLREACIMALIATVDTEKGPEPRVTDALILHSKGGPLGEPSRRVRMEAIIALGAVGRPHDPKTLEQVRGALKDHINSRDKAINIWAHVSLMALEDKVNEKDIKMIVDCLGEKDREIRMQAVTALGAMAKKASEHVKDICKLLEKEREPMVQVAACRALPRMGDKSDRVLQALIRLTKLDNQKTNEVVLAACAALGHFHVDSPEVMAAMKAVLNHKALSEQEMKMVEESIKVLESPLPDAPKPKGKADKK
ncbi:MAG TPA: HEAT repeat domain-containing protein [Gemmataceae bacterium]|jgi:HEAT repeat protein